LTSRIREKAVVPDALAGKRFDQAAASVFPEFSRARLQQWIRQGALTIDGEPAKPTFKIKGGETFSLDAVTKTQAVAAPQDIPLDLIHVDDDIIVLNKPAGLVVHPAPGHREGTLLNALLFYDNHLSELPRAGLVHRLDRDTTGVMVVARSLRAHTSLVRQLQARSMSRIYRAVVIGEPITGCTVEAPIGRHPTNRKKMAVVRKGKPAVTHFRVLERFRGFTYIEVALETGRTHQIRVHMTHQGYSLLGDPVYGRRIPAKNKTRGLPESLVDRLCEFSRQALHAYRLKLRHPEDEHECEFEAPLPEDFENLVKALRDDAQLGT
jgi:23S rRNA pseudouridine1911/1915/1917 synthase